MIKHKKIILKGHINKTEVLWEILISIPLRHGAHTIITINKTKTELIQYLHGYWFIPTPRTFLKVIKNVNLLTWTCLNNQKLLNHLPPSIETSVINMYQESNNLQSTKRVKSGLELEEDREFYPDIETVKTHKFWKTIIPFNIKRRVFSDLTAAFPQKSSRWNLYVMVLYDYDSNAILAKPIKNSQ